MDLTLTRAPLDDLTTYPRNPRRGDIHTIAESLKRRGQYRPIVVSSDKVILAGNHTYLAARSLGWAEIDVVTVPFEHTTPAAREIVLVDNRAADQGTYDDRDLLDLLQSLGDIDNAAVGYNAGDVDALLALLEAGNRPHEEPDDEDDQDILDHSDATRWPTVSFQLHPKDHDRWKAVPQETDINRALYLLTRFET